jgi:hypothetical protein
METLTVTYFVAWAAIIVYAASLAMRNRRLNRRLAAFEGQPARVVRDRPVVKPAA